MYVAVRKVKSTFSKKIQTSLNHNLELFFGFLARCSKDTLSYLVADIMFQKKMYISKYLVIFSLIINYFKI